MKRILFILLKILVGILVLVVLGTVFYFGWEKYQRYSWEPSPPDGLTLDMTKSDLIFKLGECDKSETNYDYCGWPKEHPTLAVVFFPDSQDIAFIRWIHTHPTKNRVPFSSADEMRDILGDEDIYSESADFTKRQYTYFYPSWAYSVAFDRNGPGQYEMGHDRWGTIDNATDNSKYIIKGKQICPGDDCPFDSEGKVKSEFKDKDYTYFLDK